MTSDIRPGSISPMRLSIPEAAAALRCSRALLYKRIQAGALRVQKDGARSFITPGELARYVEELERASVTASKETESHAQQG